MVSQKCSNLHTWAIYTSRRTSSPPRKPDVTSPSRYTYSAFHTATNNSQVHRSWQQNNYRLIRGENVFKNLVILHIFAIFLNIVLLHYCHIWHCNRRPNELQYSRWLSCSIRFLFQQMAASPIKMRTKFELISSTKNYIIKRKQMHINKFHINRHHLLHRSDLQNEVNIWRSEHVWKHFWQV